VADPYQMNSKIARAICEARGDHPDQRMDPEEAKQIAKCIVLAQRMPALRSCPRIRDDQCVVTAARGRPEKFPALPARDGSATHMPECRASMIIALREARNDGSFRLRDVPLSRLQAVRKVHGREP
jgi:hypothetical protein